MTTKGGRQTQTLQMFRDIDEIAQINSANNDYSIGKNEIEQAKQKEKQEQEREKLAKRL